LVVFDVLGTLNGRSIPRTELNSRGARSALGPCRNGRARASAVTSGHRRLRGTAGAHPSRSSSRDDPDGRFRLWSRRAGVRVPSVTLGHCRSYPPVSPLPVGVVDHPSLQFGVDPGDLIAESSMASSGSGLPKSPG
jgi:hypothetical protein